MLLELSPEGGPDLAREVRDWGRGIPGGGWRCEGSHRMQKINMVWLGKGLKERGQEMVLKR